MASTDAITFPAKSHTHSEYAAKSHTHDSLTNKTLNSTTINNTAGSFTFEGSQAPWSGTDWVGLQVGSSVDKFQISTGPGGLAYRSNDSGGTDTNWGAWQTLSVNGHTHSYAATNHTHSYAATNHTHNSVLDVGNNTATTFRYSAAGLTTTSWFAAWNGYELRAISPTNTRTVIGAAASSHTHSYYPTANILAGSNYIDANSANANHWTAKTISFGRTFSSTPKVLLTLYTMASSENIVVTSVSTTQFVAQAWCGTGTFRFGFYWLAII